MILHTPFIITPRIMPGVAISDCFISIGYSRRPGRDGRTRYIYHIDQFENTFTGDDLQSGHGAHSLQDGMVSLLSFLSACGESLSFRRRTGGQGENEDLFPAWVAQWASKHADDITMLQLEIEESETDLIEE